MNSQKFDTSSLQGQKQLIDLGKTLENVREIEEIRSQKENGGGRTRSFLEICPHNF